MKLKAKKNFSWAHRGCDVVDYAAGEIIETDDADLIEVATREDWVEGGKKQPAEDKAQKSAPENK